jgi:arginyl-tRNA synthetase
MYTLDKAKKEIIAALAATVPSEVTLSEAELVKPPQKDMGDLSYPCFGLAKALKGNPAALAKDLAAKLAPAGLVGEIRAVGPYVNFFFDRAAFATSVLEDVLGRAGEYGDAPKTNGRVMIEYGQPNTHKEIHVGHLRNLALGLAVVNLTRAAGHDAVPVSYIGDIGAHVAKCLWALKKFHADEQPPENRGKFLGQVYTEASRKVEEDESLKEEVAAVQRKLEARDPEWDALWQETRQWSIDEMNAIFNELGCFFERMYFESEVEGPGKELVQELRGRGIAKEGERGAIIVDLEAEKLGIFLVLKSDGSALYSTKELALARKKFEDYTAIGTSIHVVDTRQALYFQQCFATLKRMGFDKEMHHLAYEFVTLKEGAMSSRKGNIVTYEDFRDAMKEMAAKETKNRRTEWSDEKVAETAWAVAEGAMKFGMLKQDTERPIVFDMEEALDFNGFTGPYIQYSHARLASILAKAEGETVSVCRASEDPAEFALLRVVADLPEVILRSAEARKPSLLAQYLFDLAQEANAFYRDVHVLSAEGEDRGRRIAIAGAAKEALARGLGLLGIKAPEEM